MGSFKLGKMTFEGMFKKPETVCYPVEQRPAPAGLKGHIVVDIETCISCGICMKRCPTGAITVVKDEGSWSINRFKCIQCGHCVRECPKACLSMAPTYAHCATQKSTESFFKQPAALDTSSESIAAGE